jgi:predicted membrane-bound mannosyltransferase
VLYSLLPYKTPWCLLGFWQTAIVVAGIGAFAFVRAMPGRILKVAMSLMLLGATWQLNNQALSANDRFRADRRNPYVYAHSSTDVADFGKQMEEIAASTREGHKMLVVVVAPDAWPLPWYLRRFENVGFWNDPTDPALKNALRNATVVLAAAELQPQIQSQLRTLVPQHAFNEQTRSLRPTVFFVANVRSDAWNAFMARR